MGRKRNFRQGHSCAYPHSSFQQLQLSGARPNALHLLSS